MSAPEDALGDGPYIYVALPEYLVEPFPVNATRLLREWEASLDPTRQLADAAKGYLRWSWALSDRFVEPSPWTLGLVRHAGKDEAVIRIFEESNATVAHPSAQERPIQEMVVGDDDDQRLAEAALPVLLGLGVLAPTLLGQTYYARQLMAAMDEAARREA